MITRRGVLVVNVDRQFLAKAPTHIELHARCVPDQLGRDVDLHVFVSDRAIGSEVLAFEVHVDRHVKFGATSTDRRNEVDRCHAAALSDQLGRFTCEIQLHCGPSALEVGYQAVDVANTADTTNVDSKVLVGPNPIR